MQENLKDNPIETLSRSITYEKKTPCGKLYITFVLKDNEKIDYVLIDGVKNAVCGKANIYTHADNLTFMLRRARNKHELGAIIKNFRFHGCNKTFVGMPKSCSDAIADVLNKMLKVEEGE